LIVVAERGILYDYDIVDLDQGQEYVDVYAVSSDMADVDLCGIFL
jgi:hypothetical protein